MSKKRKDHVIRLITERSIPEDVRLVVRSLARWLRVSVPPGRTVVIHQMNGESFRVEGADCFGFFRRPSLPPSAYSGPLRIFVAAGLVDVVEAEFDLRDQGIEAYLHTILHEWAHFEEWRDGLEPDEQRADARADQLLSSFRELHPTAAELRARAGGPA